MRISFFGHAEFYESDKVREKILKLLRERATDKEVEFFFGGYGRFDDFAYSVVKDFKDCLSSRLIFVTPYITESYQKTNLNIRDVNMTV